ncbi:hypothetical protein J132_02615 [Termitomyces sp. J132]|nr:hypothetical protein J132_02615 [Termitomyces sp. J132]
MLVVRIMSARGIQKVENATDSYNDSSMKAADTRNKLKCATDSASFSPRLVIDTATGRTDDTEEIQERRGVMEGAAHRPVSQQVHARDPREPNGDKGLSVVTAPPCAVDFVSSESGLSSTDTNKESSQTTGRLWTNKPTEMKNTCVEVTTVTETQRPAAGQNLLSTTGTLSMKRPASDTIIDMENPFGILQVQLPHPSVANQHQHPYMSIPPAMGCPNFGPPQGSAHVTPSFPLPHPLTQHSLRHVRSPHVLKVELNAYKDSRNPFASRVTVEPTSMQDVDGDKEQDRDADGHDNENN